MPVTLIHQNPAFTKKVDGYSYLAISEMFADTIQGEGVNAGVPATFIRLQGCTLKCTWCDTLDVWPNGNEYSFKEILDMLEPFKEKYEFHRQHLVLTGGSPLKQQDMIIEFVAAFKKRFGFKPYIEIENECVLKPEIDLIRLVDCWNNSPKLSNSGMKDKVRIKPEILVFMNKLRNSWFKFVVSDPGDWIEIERDFLPHIDREKIILMPEGQTQIELLEVREKVAEIAVQQQVRFSDRLHITIWDKKTGV
jgi:7-carboxy-7-deazaguanine synthase